MIERATIYSYSIVHSSTEEFKDKTPYVTAVLEAGGLRFAAFVAGYTPGVEVKIGQEVVLIGQEEDQKPIYQLE